MTIKKRSGRLVTRRPVSKNTITKKGITKKIIKSTIKTSAKRTAKISTPSFSGDIISADQISSLSNLKQEEAQLLLGYLLDNYVHYSKFTDFMSTGSADTTEFVQLFARGGRQDLLNKYIRDSNHAIEILAHGNRKLCTALNICKCLDVSKVGKNLDQKIENALYEISPLLPAGRKPGYGYLIKCLENWLSKFYGDSVDYSQIDYRIYLMLIVLIFGSNKLWTYCRCGEKRLKNKDKSQVSD